MAFDTGNEESNPSFSRPLSKRVPTSKRSSQRPTTTSNSQDLHVASVDRRRQRHTGLLHPAFHGLLARGDSFDAMSYTRARKTLTSTLSCLAFSAAHVSTSLHSTAMRSSDMRVSKFFPISSTWRGKIEARGTLPDVRRHLRDPRKWAFRVHLSLSSRGSCDQRRKIYNGYNCKKIFKIGRLRNKCQ